MASNTVDDDTEIYDGLNDSIFNPNNSELPENNKKTENTNLITNDIQLETTKTKEAKRNHTI